MAVGRLVRAHGTRGEVAVFPLTEHVERFDPGRRMYLSPTPEALDDAIPVVIESSRPHRGGYLLKLDRVETRSGAEQLVGQFLVIPFAEAEKARAENEFFLHSLVGCEVRTADGRRLGMVVDVLEPRGAAMLEIAEPAGPRRLLPFVKEFVLEVRDDEIVVKPPQGWEEL